MITEDFEKVGCKILKVREWTTPATKYPEQKVGTAEIKKGRYTKDNLYLMEGVDGYDLFYSEKTIHITELKISGETWMVDDPLHWTGMNLLGKEAKGNVLVAGLGLGLVLHSLAENPLVKKIDVVEMNKDVIELMKDKIPEKVNIIQGDIFKFTKNIQDYDTIILDIWVGYTDWHTYAEMKGALNYFRKLNPKSNIFIWGSNDREINPSVKKELAPITMEIKKGMR